MTGVHVVVGAALLAASAAAALYGGLLYARASPRAPGFWPLMRAAQALVVVQALVGGALLVAGRDLPELHLVYGLTPVAISFVAEQLRVVSAEVVLDRHGLESADAMRARPQAEQNLIVIEIVRREIGVMTAAAAVTASLAARAAGLY